MPKWLLPTLSEVLALSDPTWMVGDNFVNAESSGFATSHQRAPRRLVQQQLRAEREWYGAIAALNLLLQRSIPRADTQTHTIDMSGEASQCAFVLAGPSPVLSGSDLMEHVSSWAIAATSMHSPNWLPLQLLPAGKNSVVDGHTSPTLPLLPGDPLAAEPFCLALTPWFSLIMVLGETLTEEPAFMFSFAPDVVQRAWDAIRPRILLMSSHQVDHLDELVQRFPPVTPDYKTVMQFSRLLLENLPEQIEDGRTMQSGSLQAGDEAGVDAAIANPGATTTAGNGAKDQVVSKKKAVRPKPIAVGREKPTPPLPDTSSLDVELVQAIAHEVRTPLSTIRTLTRSLLKRSDLSPDVIKRLGIIDRECSEQIDRFGLIFRAVELETSASHQFSTALIRTSLADVFKQCIPRWQQAATHRQMTLNVRLPVKMPTVVSDPTMLDQALTSLIERFTRNLPAGNHIQVDVTLAGDQLKLQLQSQPDANAYDAENPFSGQNFARSLPKSLGQLLTFQPETGSLSLNLKVTKNLFQAIGGKLIVKHRPKQGEVMTVYLPLEVDGTSPLDHNKIITV